MIRRFYHNLLDWIPDKRALIVYGARRVGKTTLIDEFLKNTKLHYKVDSGDNIQIQQLLSSNDFSQIKEYAENYDLIILDEAQNIQNIGQVIKIMVDQIPNLQVIATGSSSFAIQQQVGEPLTGRKRELILFPLSLKELNNHFNRFEIKQQLEDLLIFGSYPEIYTTLNKNTKKEYLEELVGSYLLKDILTLDKIRNSEKLYKLLSLIAFQIGSEISVHELSKQIKLDVKTIERYLDLLQKSFVIYKLPAISKNPRKEITKKSKYYFLDNGVRNAVIKQFNTLNYRNDIGQLWENFVLSERLKKLKYEQIYLNRYFWRTYQQQEIDYVEEIEGELFAYEVKYKPQQVKLPKTFKDSYQPVKFETIHRENFLDFLL